MAREEELLAAKAAAEAKTAAAVAAASKARVFVAAAAKVAMEGFAAAAAAADAQLQERLAAIIGGQGSIATVRLASHDLIHVKHQHNLVFMSLNFSLSYIRSL